jgi:hypothetical protein
LAYGYFDNYYAQPVGCPNPRLWSVPATWPNGDVPDNETESALVQTVGGCGTPVKLDFERVAVKDLTIDPGQTLRFDPSTQQQQILSSKASVIVNGTLEMKPNNAGVVQKFQISGADEWAFKGKGMGPFDCPGSVNCNSTNWYATTDVGLWVTGAGRLDIVGTPKTAWLRAAGSINVGDNVIALDSVPTGWANGDKIRIAPTAHTGTDLFAPMNTFEERTIDHVAVDPVTQQASVYLQTGETTQYAHPAVRQCLPALIRRAPRRRRRLKSST